MDDARALVSLPAVAANFRALREFAGVPALAAVKADAYGHGAVPVARRLEREGAALLGVATAGEALALREGGVEAPLLLLTPPRPAALPALVAAGVSFAVSSSAEVAALAAEARAARRGVAVHLKVNTGLNRLGVAPEDAGRLLAELGRSGLSLEGVFTHLVDSEDAEPQHALRQLERFGAFLLAHRPGARYVHAANTGGVTNPALAAAARELGCNLVRLGIGLYGYAPGPDVAGATPLTPAMTLESWVVFVRRVAQGEIASYNATWTAREDTTIVSVRIGYADGYPRALSNKGRVVVGGEVRPVVGRVCMDQLLVDVSGLEVAPGDPVTLFGPGPVTAETLADLAGTNSYEILTGIGPRVERVHG